MIGHKFSIWPAAMAVALGLGVFPVQAQLQTLDGGHSFEASRTVRLGSAGDLAEDRRNWGVSIQAAGGGVVVLRDFSGFSEINILPPPLLFLVNEPPEGGDSSNLPLVIDFAHAVRRVGLRLATVTGTAVASVAAYDLSGASLGRLEGETISPVSQLVSGTFLGLESIGDPISKVVIDYGASASPELLGSLIVEFVSRPNFRTVIAQVARAGLPDGGRLETSIALVSLSNSTARGEVRILDRQGRAVSFGGEDHFPLEAPPGAGQFWDTLELSQGDFSGYAVIDSNVPVFAAAVYRATDAQGLLVSEAGVAGTAPGRRLAGSAEELRRRATVGSAFGLNDVRSAVAAVNLSDEPAYITVRFGGLQESRLLQPGEQLAAFLSQLVPLQDDRDRREGVLIFSPVPIAATLLQTANGLPQASLPLVPASP